jgi:oxygen-independent coproporphyrinogen-3 oxidase
MANEPHSSLIWPPAEHAYVHIPFCSHKCDFCDFAAFSGLESQEAQYVETLLAEIKERLKDCDHRALKTLHFGGGTPGLLALSHLERIIKSLEEQCGFVQEIFELALETTPQAITRENALGWKKLGINRLSIGIESFNDEELEALGRKQTSREAIAAIELAQECGFSNINLDFMFGLPLQTQASFDQTMLTARDLIKANSAIKHLSAYSLEFAVSAPLLVRYPLKSPAYPSDDETVAMLEKLMQRMDEVGFEHYEVSNFAEPGYESLHNLSYWTHKSYLAFGVGAHRFTNGIRSSNYRSFNKYLAQPLTNESEEPIDARIALEEAIMLGLRLRKGVNLEALKTNFGYDLLKEKARDIKTFLEEDLLALSDSWLSVTRKGLPISNSVISRLI